MTHERFSESDAWELENPEDDLRGRTVLGDRGETIGRVEDMLIDTATQSIDAVILEDGREVPAINLDISGRDLRLIDGSGMAGTSGPGETGMDVPAGSGATGRDLRDADRMRGTELEEELRDR